MPSVRKQNYSIKDIADYVGVSRSTVSRVLNNVHTRIAVSAETCARIHEAIRHFDYTPNASARRLAVKKSFVIGLQLPIQNVNNHAFNDYNLIGAMLGFEEALRGTDYRLQLIFGSRSGLNDHAENLRLLKSKSIDGLLIWGALTNENIPRELESYPVLLLNSLPEKFENFSTIVHDDYRGSRRLIQELIQEGASRFLYVMGPEKVSICQNRYRGFLDTLLENNIPFQPEQQLFHGDFGYDSVIDQARTFFMSGGAHDYDAVVCVNDKMATAFFDAAVAAGVTPQKDIILAGADDVEDCARYNLRTYKCDRFHMGTLAIHQIIRQIEETVPQTPEHLCLPTLVSDNSRRFKSPCQ